MTSYVRELLGTIDFLALIGLVIHRWPVKRRDLMREAQGVERVEW